MSHPSIEMDLLYSVKRELTSMVGFRTRRVITKKSCGTNILFVIFMGHFGWREMKKKTKTKTKKTRKSKCNEVFENCLHMFG